MGRSADAKLFYGARMWESEDTPEEWEEWRDADESWEELVFKVRGGVDPWDAMPEAPDSMGYAEREAFKQEWIFANRQSLDARWDAIEAIRDEFPVQTVFDGSDDFVGCYIAVSESVIRCDWGEGTRITPDMLAVFAEWNDQLDAWYEVVGQTPPAEYGWWLTVSYG